MSATLWSRSPSTRFEEAVPLGNGRLGAVLHGHPLRREDYYSERILLTEETLWASEPEPRDHPDSRAALPEVRRLLLAGRIAEAEYLADLALTAAPRGGGPTQPLGELVLTARHDHAPVSGYRRDLDLDRGVAGVAYRALATRFTTRVFVSRPDDVVVVRLRADGPARLDFHACLRRRPFEARAWRAEGPVVGFTGELAPGGVGFDAALSATCAGGSVRRVGQCLVIENATEATLILSAATTFRHARPRARALAVLRAAARRAADELETRHAADYAPLAAATSLRLGRADGRAVDERVARARAGEDDPALHALLFRFGRHLMISGSRPGCLPLTLQGIWPDRMTPMWNANYTLNVNLQMSYWPAETAGLPACHAPLFDFLRRLAARGRDHARKVYGCRGYVAHHTSDLWADPAPTGGVYASALWPFGAAWLALHAWEHHRFTDGSDPRFLREQAYPLLRDAVRFFEDYLAPGPDGAPRAMPSVSPENWFVDANGARGKLCAGAAMDAQILRELLAAAIAAAAELRRDAPARRRWTALRAALPPDRIAPDGRLREWQDDHAEADPGHRHLSHLFAVFPGSTITPQDTPELARAARAVLREKLRHDTDRTGWSQAWMAAIFARLHDGDAALDCLRRLLARFTHGSLMGDCPPLNLDSNFGFVAAIAEMLLQSHRDELHLLPALPSAWADGEVSGLRARGGVTVGLVWRGGKLRRATLLASRDREVVLRVGRASATQKISLRAGIALSV